MKGVVNMMPKWGALLLMSLIIGVAHSSEPQIFGWLEHGEIEGIALDFKLDTGADTSSLDARSIREFDQDGKHWASFVVPSAADGEAHRFERPIVRYALVRGAGGSERRPVVRMTVCLADEQYREEFTLNDRSKMSYPVLIGRSTLQHMHAAVAAERQYTRQGDCAN